MTYMTWFVIAAIIAGYFLLSQAVESMVERFGAERNVAQPRIHYVAATLKLALMAIAVAVLIIIIGIDRQELGLFFGSVFAILGVALFAQWSILSNLAASIIIFFFFPYRVGDHIRLLDGENSVSGLVSEISLFHVIVESDKGDVATIPNSLVFQKAVEITVNHTPLPES